MEGFDPRPHGRGRALDVHLTYTKRIRLAAAAEVRPRRRSFADLYSRVKERGHRPRGRRMGFKSGGWRASWSGDGETRTPDPLLAKQVLYPAELHPRLVVQAERGPLWTRTTDLTVISRALLPPELKAPGARGAQLRRPSPERWGRGWPRGVRGAVPAHDGAGSSLTPEAWSD